MKVHEKVIENYKLFEIQRILPNGIHVIRAKNIETSMNFTIKKACINFQEKNPECQLSQGYKSILKEIQILQNLSIPRVIKCHKFIKTKRNIYAVYDDYPQLQLGEYIQKCHPNIGQRINIAHIICQTLINIHRSGYIYVNLNPGCILINPETNEVRFVGLESCVRTKEISVKKLVDQSSFMAPQLRYQKKVSVFVDSFSFGKILKMLEICESFDPEGVLCNTPIQNILGSLTSQQPFMRASLETAMLCLQLKYNYNSTNESMQQNSSSEKSRKHVSLKNIKTIDSQRKRKNKSRSRKLEPLKPSKQFQNRKKIKKIIKFRNLYLFLAEQAKFCIGQNNFELAYLLLKKSVIICGNLFYSTENIQLKKDNSHDYTDVLQVIEKQYQEYKTFLAKIKKIFKRQTNQVQNQHTLNQQYLQQSIRAFIKLKKQKINLEQIRNSSHKKELYHLCYLSQKLSYGSFQKFFDDGIHEEEIELSQQRYFHYIKTLTTKQLLAKIDRTLQK